MKNEKIEMNLLTGKTKKKEWEKINEGLISGKTKILSALTPFFKKSFVK